MITGRMGSPTSTVLPIAPSTCDRPLLEPIDNSPPVETAQHPYAMLEKPSMAK
ncbi:hypothetical protein HUU61_14765 [Rhodopseudomonas palustris]|nr:hypothetical protein [Rhodopseudomonas palustris]